jgi:membrane-associated phospholipid phosphatase
VFRYEILDFVFICLVVLLGEFGWKTLFSESRPDESCVVGCGMPSSHAALSIGLLFVIIVNGMKYGFKDVEDEAEHRNKLWTSILYPTNGAFRDHAITYATFLFVWFILLMPVPFARVILNDHSITQVLLGSLIGLGEGFLWILLIQYLATHKEHSPLFNSNQ